MNNYEFSKRVRIFGPMRTGMIPNCCNISQKRIMLSRRFNLNIVKITRKIRINFIFIIDLIRFSLKFPTAQLIACSKSIISIIIILRVAFTSVIIKNAINRVHFRKRLAVRSVYGVLFFLFIKKINIYLPVATLK